MVKKEVNISKKGQEIYSKILSAISNLKYWEFIAIRPLADKADVSPNTLKSKIKEYEELQEKGFISNLPYIVAKDDKKNIRGIIKKNNGEKC